MLSLKCYIARVQTCPNISSLPTRRSLQQKGTKPFYPSSTLLTISEPKTFSNHPTFESHHTPPQKNPKKKSSSEPSCKRPACAGRVGMMFERGSSWLINSWFRENGPMPSIGMKTFQEKKSTVRMVHLFMFDYYEIHFTTGTPRQKSRTKKIVGSAMFASSPAGFLAQYSLVVQPG